jgi:hypothetical protein
MKPNITKKLAIHEDARFFEQIHSNEDDDDNDKHPITGRTYVWGKHL